MILDFQKKDWQFRDLITEGELNRMEGGIEEGITKAEQAQDTADNAISEATAAQDAINNHITATTGVHGATSAATANTLVQRDSSGRFKAAAPYASDDVARKAETDAAMAAAQAAYRNRGTASVSDFNQLTALGSYLIGNVSGIANEPGLGNNLVVEVSDGGGYIIQHATSVTNYRQKYRTRWDTGQWQPWREIITQQGGAVEGKFYANNGIFGASGWGTLSSNADGNAMIAHNAYLHPSDGTYRYQNTHASLGARGIVFIWNTSQNAAVPHWFDMGRIATTADATFTPTLIPIITSAGNQTINGRIDIGNFAYISNDGTNEFAVFGADTASGGGNRLLLAATDLRVGLSVAASNTVWHTGNQGDPSSLLTSSKQVVGAINELFTSASNGKNQIAAAITGKGVPASGSDTFAQLASKIEQIVVGKPFAQGQTSTDAANVLTVSGLSFRPTLILCRWYYTSYFQKVYLEEYYPPANRFYQTFTSPTTATITYDTDWTILENGFVVKLTHPNVLISWYAVGTGG